MRHEGQKHMMRPRDMKFMQACGHRFNVYVCKCLFKHICM